MPFFLAAAEGRGGSLSGTLASVDSVVGGNQLGEQLCELAQLEYGGCRVFTKIALGERSQLNELRVMDAQECKILGDRHPSILDARYTAWVLAATTKKRCSLAFAVKLPVLSWQKRNLALWRQRCTKLPRVQGILSTAGWGIICHALFPRSHSALPLFS
jgi:hypothetical protein